MKKKSFMIIALLCFIFVSNIIVFGANESWGLGDDPTASEISEAVPIAEKVLGTMQWVGYLIAILMLVWVGIRYVTSSVGEKVKAKESLMPMVIGAILVAGAAWLAEAWFNI